MTARRSDPHRLPGPPVCCDPGYARAVDPSVARGAEVAFREVGPGRAQGRGPHPACALRLYTRRSGRTTCGPAPGTAVDDSARSRLLSRVPPRPSVSGFASDGRVLSPDGSCPAALLSTPRGGVRHFGTPYLLSRQTLTGVRGSGFVEHAIDHASRQASARLTVGSAAGRLDPPLVPQPVAPYAPPIVVSSEKGRS